MDMVTSHLEYGGVTSPSLLSAFHRADGRQWRRTRAEPACRRCRAHGVEEVAEECGSEGHVGGGRQRVHDGLEQRAQTRRGAA